jgi:hypothetical protein
MNQMVEVGGGGGGGCERGGFKPEKIHQNPQNPPAGPLDASSILCSHYV